MTDASFLHDYLDHVERARDVLVRATGDENPFQAWKEGRADREGRIDGDGTDESISWRFHSAGCEVHFGEVVVDMAAGPGGRLDGFDQPRLGRFVNSRGSTYRELRLPAAMRRAFAALKAEGIVRCPRWNPGVQLCYLSTAIDVVEPEGARPAA